MGHKGWTSPLAGPAIGPYRQATEAGGFVFLSGQLALDEAGNLIQGGVAEQTRKALEAPHVESIPMVCDECGEPIWMSKELIDRISEKMPERPDAVIMYLCITHFNPNDQLAPIEEYGCPACNHITDTFGEMFQHFNSTHRKEKEKS